MWPLLKLVFSRNYWRALTRKSAWQATSIAFCRAHKDGRSRRQLARQLHLLLVPFAIVLWIVGICTLRVGGICTLRVGGVGLVWITVLLMLGLSRYGYGKRQKSSQTLSSKLGEELAALRAGPDVRRELAELCLVHAVLIDRASSERYVKTKTLPEGVEVITRRRHLAILREAGLYERLGSIERGLLLMPDGHWPEHMLHRVGLALENLRVLRWVLRLDHYLPSQGETLDLDYRLASSLLQKPGDVLSGERLVSDLTRETGEHTARQFFYRCWAELLHRGVRTPENDEQAREAEGIVSRFAGKEGTDYLLGRVIVSKAEDGLVEFARLLAARRWQLLEWVGKRINGKADALDCLHVFYLGDGYLGLDPDPVPEADDELEPGYGLAHDAESQDVAV